MVQGILHWVFPPLKSQFGVLLPYLIRHRRAHPPMYYLLTHVYLPKYSPQVLILRQIPTTAAATTQTAPAATQ